MAGQVGLRSTIIKEADRIADLGLVPEVEPNHQFWLAAHPLQWVADADGYFRPSWRKVFNRPGVDGFPEVPRGTQEWQQAQEAMKARVRAEGYRVVPYDAGPGGTSYLRATECRGGKYYHLWCEELYAGDSAVGVDKEDLDKWVRELVQKGIIDPPAKQAVVRTVAQLTRAIEKAETRGHSDARARSESVRLRAARDAVQSWIVKGPVAASVALEDDEVPVVAPSKGKGRGKQAGTILDIPAATPPNNEPPPADGG